MEHTATATPSAPPALPPTAPTDPAVPLSPELVEFRRQYRRTAGYLQ